jgi:hypothetical protein
VRFNLIPPKHTGADVVRRLAKGLRDGSVVLAPTPEAAKKTTAASLADLVHTIANFLDERDVVLRKMRRLEVELLRTAIGMAVVGVGLVIMASIALLIGGTPWLSSATVILGSLSCLASIWPFRLVRRLRYHLIRDELLVAILRATPDEERPWQFLRLSPQLLLRATPDEERPWQFLRLSPQLQEDLEKAEAEAGKILECVKRVCDGWRLTPPPSSLSTT